MVGKAARAGESEQPYSSLAASLRLLCAGQTWHGSSYGELHDPAPRALALSGLTSLHHTACHVMACAPRRDPDEGEWSGPHHRPLLPMGRQPKTAVE